MGLVSMLHKNDQKGELIPKGFRTLPDIWEASDDYYIIIKGKFSSELNNILFSLVSQTRAQT